MGSEGQLDRQFVPPGDPRYTPSFVNNHKRYNFNNKIMLTAIISLFIVTVIVVILHLYARYIVRRQARRARLRQLTMGVAAMQVQSHEPPKTGLDPSVIASLPIIVYKQTDPINDDDDAAATIECAVCLSTLEEEEMVRVLPNCRHTFHAECIDMWFGSHSTCPICRTMAEPRPQLKTHPQPNESGDGVPPTAPSIDSLNPSSTTSEGTSDGAVQSPKGGASVSRLSSFRRILSRERSERRIQPCEQADGVEDIERQ